LKKFISKYSIALNIGWAIIILILCATPGQYIPSANWIELLSFDKFVHASLFFILCILSFINGIIYQKSKSTFVLLFLSCVLYGGLLEIMQAKCFNNRSADWQDFFANSFGCLIAALTFKILKSYLKITN